MVSSWTNYLLLSSLLRSKTIVKMVTTNAAPPRAIESIKASFNADI